MSEPQADSRFESDPALKTLRDATRSGRPSTVPLAIRCQLVRLACERLNHEIMRFRDVWTYASLSDVLVAKTGYRLSTSEIGRILRFKEIRPHHVAQWLHSEDPEFLPKAEAVCDLYLNRPRTPFSPRILGCGSVGTPEAAVPGRQPSNRLKPKPMKLLTFRLPLKPCVL